MTVDKVVPWPIGQDRTVLVTVEDFVALLSDLTMFGSAYVKDDGTRVPPADVGPEEPKPKCG